MFRLGNKSLKNLEGVHPLLVSVVKRAIEITEQDFSVFEGLRSLVRQRTLVDTGKSRTMNSKHLTQESGYGHAVDLVPYKEGGLHWDWELIYPVAEAMKKAAEELGVNIRWGGYWDILNGSPDSPRVDVAQYVRARKDKGLSAFIDGPHFELVS